MKNVRRKRENFTRNLLILQPTKHVFAQGHHPQENEWYAHKTRTRSNPAASTSNDMPSAKSVLGFVKILLEQSGAHRLDNLLPIVLQHLFFASAALAGAGDGNERNRTD